MALCFTVFWSCLMSQTVIYECIQLLIHQLETFGYIADALSFCLGLNSVIRWSFFVFFFETYCFVGKWLIKEMGFYGTYWEIRLLLTCIFYLFSWQCLLTEHVNNILFPFTLQWQLTQSAIIVYFTCFI